VSIMGKSSLLAVDFLGLLDAAKTAQASRRASAGDMPFAQIQLDGHFQSASVIHSSRSLSERWRGIEN